MNTGKKSRFAIQVDNLKKEDRKVLVREYGYNFRKVADVLDETNYDQEVYYSLTDRGDFD